MEKNEPSAELDRCANVVIGAALEVHRTLGPGFWEGVYEEALTIELASRGVPFGRQVPLRVTSKGYSVGEGRVDLLINGHLVVELKSVEMVVPLHIAQVVSYLRAFGRPLGLLINFNTKLLRDGIRRVVLSRV